MIESYNSTLEQFKFKENIYFLERNLLTNQEQIIQEQEQEQEIDLNIDTDTDTDTLQNYQKSEVSKIEWKTLDECLSSIRPYNLEKKTIIKNVNQVLLNYILSY